MVSIHALLAECDFFWYLLDLNCKWFQSTHSLRSATRDLAAAVDSGDVSIHALLAECDRCNRLYPRNAPRFNPRTPCGVRPGQSIIPPQRTLFQSTHSLRSATALADLDMIDMWVSIHALLAECDGNIIDCPLAAVQFQSTHSLRSATLEMVSANKTRDSFNPRTPCGVRH